MKREAVEEREKIVQKLKDNGCRITKQRMTILDVILEKQCTSCKEIFFYASRRDEKIGIATVYRMVSALEDAGILTREIVYSQHKTGNTDGRTDCK